MSPEIRVVFLSPRALEFALKGLLLNRETLTMGDEPFLAVAKTMKISASI